MKTFCIPALSILVLGVSLVGADPTPRPAPNPRDAAVDHVKIDEVSPESLEKAVAEVRKVFPSLSREEIIRKISAGEDFALPVPPTTPAQEPKADRSDWAAMTRHGSVDEEKTKFSNLSDPVATLLPVSAHPAAAPTPPRTFYTGMAVITDPQRKHHTAIPSGAVLFVPDQLRQFMADQPIGPLVSFPVLKPQLERVVVTAELHPDNHGGFAAPTAAEMKQLQAKGLIVVSTIKGAPAAPQQSQ